jgi:hypothetical protein
LTKINATDYNTQWTTIPLLSTANTFTNTQTISSLYNESNVGRTLTLRHSTGGSVGITLDPVSTTQDGSISGVISLNGSTVDLGANPSAQIKMYRSASAAAGTMILQTRYGGDGLLKDRITIPDNSPILFVSPQVAVATVVAKGIAAQTANLQEWQNSAGTVLASVNSAGGISAIRADVFGSNAGAVQMRVRGASAQTANLQEWQNSSGTVLAKVDASGNAQFVSIDGGSA